MKKTTQVITNGQSLLRESGTIIAALVSLYNDAAGFVDFSASATDETGTMFPTPNVFFRLRSSQPGTTSDALPTGLVMVTDLQIPVKSGGKVWVQGSASAVITLIIQQSGNDS